MSQTQHLADLCALLVRETYGELTARIFALLLRRGRQPISAITQHAGLTGRQVRHGLVVLIQQNLLYHNTELESGITYYEANEDAAYFLLRSGRILEIIQERYGADARAVVQNLLLLGHTRIADLAEAYESESKLPNGHSNGANGNEMNGDRHGTNGHTDDKKKSVNLHGILARLLDDGFVEPLVESMFRSPTDAYNEAEKLELRRAEFGDVKAGKSVDAKRNIAKTLQKAREDRSWRTGTMKRYVTGGHMNGGDKRRKLANGKPSVNVAGAFDEDVKLDPDLVVRVNYEKCTVALRTQALTEVAANDIGEVTAQIYGELLRVLENNTPRCRSDLGDETEEDDATAPTVTTSTLAQVISNEINVAKGIGKASSNKPGAPSMESPERRRKRAHEASEESEDDVVTSRPRPSKVKFDVEEPSRSATESRQARVTQIKDHLLLLTAHNHNLLKKLSNDGLGEFTVQFKQASAYMRETELDIYIASAFGKEGLRLSHVLRKHGKLDEKQIQKIALMKQGEVRKTLVRMEMAGFADIQEVPKDALRTPSRTIFLWWFDTERVINLLLDIIYKTTCRCLEVLEAERYKARNVLALADRTDVSGHEYEMLTENHLVQLNGYREKEELLTTQMNRLDRLVGIFQEF